MKTNKTIPLLCFFTIFALLKGTALGQEVVSHVALKNGGIQFQIHNAEAGQSYRLRLEDLGANHYSEEVGGFTPGSLPQTLSGQTTLKRQGVYLIHLFRGNTEVNLHQSEIQVPDIINVENATIDRKAMTIKWRAPRSSLVRVNAILNNGMKIDTLAPWHFSSNQEHSQAWDFKDRVKVRNYRDHPNLQVYIQFIPLPDYLVVVGQPSLDDYQQCPLFSNLPLPSGDNEISMEALVKEFRSVPEVPNEQVPVVRAGTPIRVKLDPRTKKRMGNNRYEIMFYVDGQYIHEESEGADPYTFLLPKLPRASGLMYFSADLADYHGNTGACTIAAWYDATSQ